MSQMSDDEAAAREAARCRLSVLAHLDRADHGQRMALELMALQAWEVKKSHLEGANVIRSMLVSMLAEAETFVATDELCALLAGSADAYPDADMHMSDIITSSGYVHFAQPIADPGPVSGYGLLRGMSWGLTDGSDPALASFGLTKEHRLASVIGYADTRNIPDVPPSHLHNYPRIYPIVSVVWEVDVEGGGNLWKGERDRQLAEIQRAPYVRTLMAWWAVLRQRLTDVEDASMFKLAPKQQLGPARRRHPDLNDNLKIVRLARSERHRYMVPSHTRQWDKSWAVRSHWRNQYYPSLDGHRWILIPSQIRGNRDAPLAGANRVFLPPHPHR